MKLETRRRITGVVLRDLYSLRHNPPRMVEVVFWPTLELVVWGFVSVYLRDQRVPAVVAVLLGGVLLWQVMYRSQGELSLTFLEDVWSRNLLNVFVTPLATHEYIVGLLLFGTLKTAAGATLMATLALLFYGFGLFSIGPALVPFMVLLVIMGWSLGVFAIATVIRFGASAQMIAWILSFAFQPFAAVFYPVAVLPGVAQAIARVTPASYVFENMRTVLAGGTPDWSALLVAGLLDVVYVGVAVGCLAGALRYARRRGRLSRFGD